MFFGWHWGGNGLSMYIRVYDFFAMGGGIGVGVGRFLGGFIWSYVPRF